MSETMDSAPIPGEAIERFADVNGVRLRYLRAGEGSPVVLLHGYTQTSHMWHPILPSLARRHTVIAPDLRGAGGSVKPESGYDKKTLAMDIHELTASLGFDRVAVVGHDIGLMVAYAYAAQFPRATERVVLMDAFLPGIGNWKDVWLLRDLWHFHFYGEVPLALVQGRERIYFEHFWNDFAADPRHSVPEADRRIYAQAYAQPGGMRAGFEYFRSFERDAEDFARLARNRLAMPVQILTGEKASGTFLIEQGKQVAVDVHGRVVTGAGHWLMEETPSATAATSVTGFGFPVDHLLPSHRVGIVSLLVLAVAVAGFARYGGRLEGAWRWIYVVGAALALYRAPETWARRAYRHLIYFNEVDKGGHFAAWEQPDLFAAELRAAFKSLR